MGEAQGLGLVIYGPAITVRPGFSASNGIGFATGSALAARADHPVADAPERPDTQLGVVVAEPDGDDVGRMEHARQSRLRKWQRLP